jgi:two-component system CheB/CheR fusion protein
VAEAAGRIKIIAEFPMTSKRIPEPESPATAHAFPDSRDGDRPFPIVGIGASAGGLEAFTALLKHLPPDTGMGFVLVQHLDPQHNSALTEILSRATSLPVHDITDKLRVEANHAYVITPNTSLGITKGVLKVGPRPQMRLPHRPIDAFFEALAQDQRERAIGVVLSGTASDGTLGLEAIKAEGGITFAQDDSAKHDSMPRSAVAAGCVDFVFSPQQIAQELARIATHPYIAGRPTEVFTAAEDDAAAATAHEDDQSPLPSGGGETPTTGAEQARAETRRGERSGSKRAEESYRKILLLLRNHSGVDFSLYKSSTIQRRISRRLVLSKASTLEDYTRFLRGNAKELDALYSDVLISVTSFFRNPEAFDALQRRVLPELFKQPSDDPVRAWVLGCSTGQEAYSLAIAFVEAVEKAPRLRKLQVFATDLNDALLEKARHGLYAKSLAEDITPERLQRFFIEEEGGYRISKALREMVVFARQNLISDPPFSRMDLISCRNLLIYLEPSLQKKAISMFHYALKPAGHLLLGASESIGEFTDLFEPVDKKHKIYVKKAAPGAPLYLPLRKERDEHTLPPLPVMRGEMAEGLRGELNAQREADRIVVNRFAPPGVLVNDALQVLQFRGPTGRYLQPPSGKASFDVLKMAREGLMLPLRAAINQARKDNQDARKDNVRVKQNGETLAVNVEVIPLKNLRERCFLILFEEAGETLGRPRVPARQPAPERRLPRDKALRRIGELEAELAETRDYLQSMQEQHEAANEELQAANEEVQSANEELQSINEELETSKEELESSNEELATVNEEMANRNVDLNRLNNDLVNLQTSTKLAIVLLGRDLTIRRFTAQAEKELGLLATDVGRPIGHIRHNLVLDPAAGEAAPLDLERLAEEVIANVREDVREVRNKAGCWYSLRLRPYMTLDHKVDGAVLVLLDIGALKRSELAIAEARDYAESVVQTVREPLLVLDKELRVESANRAFYRVFGVAPAETLGRAIYELGNRQWDIPRLRELLEEILPQNSSIEDFQVEHDFEPLGQRTMRLNARRILNQQEKPERILLAIEDVTERMRAEEALRESEEQFRTLVEQVKDYAIFRMDPDGRTITWNTGVERILGFQEAEFIGKDIVPAIFTPEDVENGVARWELELEQAAAQGVASDDRWMRRKNGERFFASGVTTALKDDDGALVGFTKVMRDQTARKRIEMALQKSELRYRRLFEAAKDGILILDAQTLRITDANPFMSELLSYSLEQLKGKELWEIGLFQDKRESLTATRKLRKEGYLRYEDIPLQSARGGIQEVEFICNVYQVDDHAIVQCNIRDITERKRLEREITKHSEELADINRRKDEFLAMLSHELRNPLVPIINMMQLLRLQKNEDTLQQQAYTMIERQVRQLKVLIDDLLEVSRITTGRIRLNQEKVDLRGIVAQAVKAVRSFIGQRQYELMVSQPSEPIWLNADSGRLEQVVTNLLTNAIKYTEEGGHIWLTTQQEGGRAVLRLRDTGVGIDPELLPHIFELFTQAARSLDRSQGGLGIGLGLVKQLVELHGGTVEAYSSLGQGSEFVARLPIMLTSTP